MIKTNKKKLFTLVFLFFVFFFVLSQVRTFAKPPPTNTPTPKSTRTPTPKPISSCDGYCTKDINCDNGLVCFYNRCRNKDCIVDVDCDCSTSTPKPTQTSTKPPTSNPTRNPQICTPEQTQCVSISECTSGCKACSKDGTSWFCTSSDWCNWCNSLQNTRTPTRRPTQTLTPAVSCSTHTKGDANCDGKIDGIDYSMWLNRQCTTGCSRENLKADFNNDGKVNDDDYSIWFSNRV